MEVGTRESPFDTWAGLLAYNSVHTTPADSIAGPDAPKAIWERFFLSRTVPAHRCGQVSNPPSLAHPRIPHHPCYRDCLDNPNPNLKERSDQSG